MAYVGVEFTENGMIGLVNSSWLTPLKREVFWPPYKTSSAFNKAMLNNEPPDQASWKLFEIKRRFFECDDFEKAKKKIKLCEVTSEVQSSESDLERSKRLRVKRKRYSSEQSSDENEALPENSLPRPPRIPVLTSRPASGSKNDPGSTFSSHFYPAEDNVTSPHRTPLQPNVQPALSNPNVTHTGGTFSTPSCSKQTHRTFFHSSQQLTEHSPVQAPVRPSAGNTAQNNITLEKLFHEVKKLREEVKEIKALIKQTKNPVAAGLPDDMPVGFPLSSILDLEALEAYLEANDKQAELAAYFSSFGGVGVTSQVNTILRIVFTNALATLYNFVGQRDKLPFATTKLKTVIIRAIQTKSPNITRAEIENSIKVWLKHAKQRMLNEERRQQQQQQ